MITHCRGQARLLGGALLTLCYVSTGKAHAELAMRQSRRGLGRPAPPARGSAAETGAGRSPEAMGQHACVRGARGRASAMLGL